MVRQSTRSGNNQLLQLTMAMVDSGQSSLEDILRRPALAIPLLCSACSWKPKFSDLSHLLTHINSKGHLSAYQKLKIRSLADTSAATTLHVFNSWYGKYNIEALLAERLAAKDEKEANKRQSRVSNGIGTKVRRGQESVRTPHEDYDNPSSLPNGHMPTQSHLYPYLPLGQVGASGPEHSFEYHLDDSREGSIVGKDGISLAESTDPVLQEEISLRLKGPTFPGMDIFDAASDDMKRKRNQRKDSSVIQKMRYDSLSVEPVESVWTLGLDLERRRSVYDSPTPPPQDEDSASEQDLLPKRKKSAARIKSTSKSATAYKIAKSNSDARKPAGSGSREDLQDLELGGNAVSEIEEYQSPTVMNRLSGGNHRVTRLQQRQFNLEMYSQTNQMPNLQLEGGSLPALSEIGLASPSENPWLDRSEIQRRPLLSLPTNLPIQHSPTTPKIATDSLYNSIDQFGTSDRNPLYMSLVDHPSNSLDGYQSSIQTNPVFHPDRYGTTMTGFQSINGHRNPSYSQGLTSYPSQEIAEVDDFVF